jgi:hypothetical protein
MPVLTDDTVEPLSLSEQLDAMLLGWLERNADRRGPGRLDLRATAVLTIADNAMPEVEKFCAGWDITVERPARGTLAVIEGPALPVQGFSEITAMYRR